MEQTTTQHNRPLAWFEIPAADLERAVAFYKTLLAIDMKIDAMGPAKLAVFPYEKPTVGGCLMTGPGLRPSDGGAVVYLNAEPSLNAVLARVSAAGGEIVLPRTELPPGMGAFAKIRDTEGNIVGLHALD